MLIELISFNRVPLYCQWWFALITIQIGENDQRSLFSIEKDNNDLRIDILFFKVKDWPTYPPF